MVFTIRKKKKSPHAGVSPAPVPLVTTYSTASSLLNSAALLLRWQGLLHNISHLRKISERRSLLCLNAEMKELEGHDDEGVGGANLHSPTS